MGKYIGKRKGVGKITVMEVAQVGVRTRARSMAMAAENSGAEKRRKVSSGRELSFSSSLVHHITPENSASSASLSDPCVSDQVMDSCCSSNGSTEKERLKFPDLEEESGGIETSRDNLDRRERRREKTPSNEFQAESGELESTAKPSETMANSRRISMVEKMPPEAELEEFFASAEKSIRKQFTEKYNYDISKDVPLEGRYEWDKIKP